MRCNLRINALLLAVLATCASGASAGTWSSGDLFSTGTTGTNNKIRQYDASGKYLDTITVPTAPGTHLRGMAFGTDGCCMPSAPKAMS